VSAAMMQANRDFIRRACNNHDALVAALKLAMGEVMARNEHIASLAERSVGTTFEQGAAQLLAESNDIVAKISEVLKSFAPTQRHD